MDHDKSKRLPPSYYTLLEASQEKGTTSTKILARYLDRSPATVRTQFQRIMEFLDVSSRYGALREAEKRGLIRRNKRATSAHHQENRSSL